ncbi:MAG: AMP-binding protein [Ilumatobacteraceae bacterium]
MILTSSYWDAHERGTDLEPLPNLTVGDALRSAVDAAPDEIALVAGVDDPALRRRWTYTSLWEASNRCAHWLLDRMDPGERLAIWAVNDPEWVIALFGAALAGVVVVPMNPAFRTTEAAHVLGPSAAVMVLHADDHRGNPIADHVAELRGRFEHLRTSVRIADLFDEIANAPSTGSLPDVIATDLAQIQFTSGTTGFPKGACLQHGSITNNARLMHRRLGLRAGDVYVNPNPMFHLGGCGLGTLGPVQFLATHVLVHHFEAGLFLDLLESESATVTGAVPTMLIALMEHPDFAHRDLSALRTVSSGGSVVPAALVRTIEDRLGVQYSTMFGQTEASPGITQTHLDDSAEDKGATVGQPLEHMSVKIVDDAGNIVAVNTSGELLARSPVVMSGYWNLPVETAAAIDDDGWLHTGDLAVMDDRGYCRIIGRLKDMITRGSENIYPREIEDVLFAHPDVAEVAVVGVPHDRLGEQVAAFIRARPGASLDIEALRTLVRESLATHKVPVQWTVVEAMPQTASGKVQKHVLRDRWVAAQTGENE